GAAGAGPHRRFRAARGALMLCRDVRRDLRRLGPDGLPEAARRHLASCAGCALEARAAALLRLGSGLAHDAHARPGLADRVRARLLADEAAGRAAGRRMDASAWQAW